MNINNELKVVVDGILTDLKIQKSESRTEENSQFYSLEGLDKNDNIIRITTTVHKSGINNLAARPYNPGEAPKF